MIGIDAGGSKTVCRLADADGHVIAEARGPGAGLHVMADADVARTLGDVIRQVSRSDRPGPSAVCLGMAGVDRPGEPERMARVLEGLIPGTRALVVSDALIALETGAPDEPGVVIVAGTGSMAYGRNAAGRAARAGGWGYVLGDEGSGYWMGRQALQAVMRAADRRGPQTALTPRVLAHWGVDRPQGLVEKVYASDPKPSTIAALASLVEDAAVAGDPIAQRIVSHGAAELATAATSVAARLELEDTPMVLGGSLFRVMPSLTAEVTGELGRRMPNSTVRPLAADPVVGAIRLALAVAEDRLRLPVYADEGD